MKFKFKLKAWREKGDPEKAVTPAIIYCSVKDGWGIAVGWWDFAAGLIILKRNE